VGETDPVVVALRRHEDLGLVLETPERLGVDDPVPIGLEDGAERVGILLAFAPLRLGGQHGSLGENLTLDLFAALADRLADESHRRTG
jgi:hypothetical protein